jgi:hypothetical protein
MIVSLFCVAVGFSLFVSSASATIINYNRDYDGNTYTGQPGVSDPPVEVEETTGTAIFTNLRTLDMAVPSNSSLDLANGITPTVLSGAGLDALTSNSGPITNLTNGQIGTSKNDLLQSVWFAHSTTTSYGRIQIVLPTAEDIGQVNTYSWHCNTGYGERSCQKYILYASNGTAQGFVDTDPTTPGWVQLASVESMTYWGGRSAYKDGQQAVSILPDAGQFSMGKYKYFIFQIYSPNSRYDYNKDGTFYQEFDIIKAVPEPGALALLAAGLVSLLAYAWRKRR